MPAQDLLERYVYELSEQQKYLENHSTLNQGTLQLSLGYLIDKGIVEVSVVHAKNLVGKCEKINESLIAELMQSSIRQFKIITCLTDFPALF